MEESISFGNDAGSMILREYNEILKEIHHTGEPQLLNNVKENMRQSVDDSQLLTDDQAVILQSELNSLKIQLEKNQLLKHVGREMDQRSIDSDYAIHELENVIQRKEKVNETMEQVLAQSMKLYEGRENILSMLEKNSGELWDQLQSLENEKKELDVKLQQQFNEKPDTESGINILKQAVCKSISEDLKFELKSFSNSMVYFQMFFKSGEEFSSVPFHFFLTKSSQQDFYAIKHATYGTDYVIDVEKIEEVPFLVPFLVEHAKKLIDC